MAGELSVMVGANGSGKSLLLQVLTGLHRPQEGRVLLGGVPFPQAYKSLGQGVGIVTQNPRTQILGQTVEEDILLSLEILGLDKATQKTECEKLLQWAGLADHHNQDPATLSGGELRRLSLASVLAMNPEFILLDEPFNGLDYLGAQDLLRILVDLKSQGKGILVVTHHLDQILALADRLLIMGQGRVVADGLPSRILPHVEDHGVRRPPGNIEEMTWLV
jgi:biotin transport system ATP-binding protein